MASSPIASSWTSISRQSVDFRRSCRAIISSLASYNPTLMIHVHAGSGACFFFLRILSTLARVSLGLAPFRYNAPSSRCSSTSNACMTGVLHSSCGKHATKLCNSLSASEASSGFPLLPVRFSTSTFARLSMHGVIWLVSSTCPAHRSECQIQA